MSFDNLAETFLWILKVEKRISINTYKSYKYDLQIFLDWVQLRAVDVFSKNVIEQFYRYLKDERANDESSILRKTNLLCRFFKYCNEENALNLEIPDIKNKRLSKSYRPFMESNDLEKIRSHLGEVKNKQNARLLCIVEILYSTGLRISELLMIQKIDINAIKKNRSLHIIGKGRVKRVIFFSDLSIKAIEDYLGYFDDLNGPLFTITRQRVFQLLKDVAMELGIKIERIFPHSFRHRLLTDLVQKGMNLINVQKIAGHKQISTTEKYTHVEDYLYEEIYKYHPLVKRFVGGC